MKRKLTITVDEELIPVAKRHARLQGMSLSSLIENSLREATTSRSQSFAARWKGKFQPAHRDDPRYEALTKKYLE